METANDVPRRRKQQELLFCVCVRVSVCFPAETSRSTRLCLPVCWRGGGITAVAGARIIDSQQTLPPCENSTDTDVMRLTQGDLPGESAAISTSILELNCRTSELQLTMVATKQVQLTSKSENLKV